MAIFGDDILWNGTIVHHATTLDKVLDHMFVVLSIILLIISCVCNPIVFWFHRRMKQNTPAVLFQILTANDFLTCLLMVPAMVYNLVSGVSLLFFFHFGIKVGIETDETEDFHVGIGKKDVNYAITISVHHLTH